MIIILILGIIYIIRFENILNSPKEKKMEKYKYIGRFNWQRELFTIFTSAFSFEKAFYNCIKKLSIKTGYSFSYMSNYFTKENYSIQLLTKKGE